MPTDLLTSTSATHLRALCVEIPNRRVGSDGNRAATRYAAGRLAASGFRIEMTPFDCIDWTESGARVSAGGKDFEAFPSPYSLGCQVDALLAAAGSLAELESACAEGQVLLLHGELAREPLMPKHFPFYNPDEHQRIIRLLEGMRPAAILTATARNPGMAGALYPFPLFEDGDFDLPSAYLTAEEGARLAEHVGRRVGVDSRAGRVAATGFNVAATKGAMERRLVVFAHIDSRIGTPGANDNASGVTALLLLGELLQTYTGRLGIELVAMNGEDYYSNPGEQLYLAAHAGRFDEIVLGINLDDVGYRYGQVAYSLYNVQEPMAGIVRTRLAAHPGLVEGDPWYQGDHGLFLMHQRPALAMTTDRLAEVMATITHSSRDTIDQVDPVQPVRVAEALRDVIGEIAGG